MYTPSQHRLIARELARAGGSVEKALEPLRLEYETLDGLSEGTIRNLLRKKEFRALVREQEKLLAKAQYQPILFTLPSRRGGRRSVVNLLCV